MAVGPKIEICHYKCETALHSGGSSLPRPGDNDAHQCEQKFPNYEQSLNELICIQKELISKHLKFEIFANTQSISCPK